MKNRIILIITSAGIGILYLTAKILIIQKEYNFVYTGCVVGILAAIWATARFYFYRESIKLALNEFFGMGTYFYKIYYPEEHANFGKYYFLKEIALIVSIIAILWFLRLTIKTRNRVVKLENLATISWILCGTFIMFGINSIFLLFSGIGYYFTGEYESTKKDQIYARFCYMAAGISLIMAFVDL